MTERIAPYLASIGIHKNGTWAAQKIIDTASTDQQVSFGLIKSAGIISINIISRFSSFVQTLLRMYQCCY